MDTNVRKMTPQERIDLIVELENQAAEHRSQAKDLEYQAKRIGSNFPACEGAFANSASSHLVMITEHELSGIMILENANDYAGDDA